MKKYGIIGLVVAAVAAIGLAGWHFLQGRDDSMASSLPADAQVVGRVDVKQLALDYGLDLSDLPRLLSQGKDEQETGIKYQTAAYVFGSQGYLGGIVPLNDKADFLALLRQQGLSIEEQRGLNWAVAGGNFLMAIADDRAVFMGPAVGAEQDALRNTLYALIRQKAGDSGKQGRLYQMLEHREEPVALVGNLGALPAELLKEYTKYLNVPIEGVDLTAGFKVRKDRLTLDFGLSSDDASMQKQLAKADDLLEEIDGDLEQDIPADGVFHLLMGIDGEDLLAHLRENRLLRTALLALNMVLDLDQVLKNIDGDVALSCLDVETPQLLFQAKLDSDKFMKNVNSWNDATARAMGFSFYTQDSHTAVCLYQGMPIYFGTNDKRLAISNSESLVKPVHHTAAKWNLSGEAKGKRLYATADVQRLLPLLTDGRPKDNVIRWISRFDRLTLSVSTLHDMRLEATGKGIVKRE